MVYDQNVEYHNDLHGVDVMQMGHHFLTECHLQEILKLNKMDCLSFLIASVAHDLGHDGFQNNYHINTVSQRAINCNDKSVQENFHASELFRIMNEDRYNFISDLSPEDFKVFRQRAIGLILATDMESHAS